MKGVKYFRSIKLAESLKTQRTQRGNINENYSNIALDYKRGFRLYSGDFGWLLFFLKSLEIRKVKCSNASQKDILHVIIQPVMNIEYNKRNMLE